MATKVTKLPPYIEADRSSENDGYIELTFYSPIDQENDEPLGSINALLQREYGEDATIDWRDEMTCWIHLP